MPTTSEPNYYSTPEDAISYTGVRMADLGFKTDEDLNDWLVKRLVEIKSMIDADRNRDYHAEVEKGIREEIPPGIHAIALRMLNNAVGYAIMRRTTPIVRVDDFSISVVEDKILTPAIKKDLRKFPAAPGFRFMVVKPGG